MRPLVDIHADVRPLQEAILARRTAPPSEVAPFVEQLRPLLAELREHDEPAAALLYSCDHAVPLELRDLAGLPALA